MALIFVAQFTMPGPYGGLYQLYYDTSNNGGTVQYTGSYVAQPSVDLTQVTWNTGIQYTAGQLIKKFCSDNPSTTEVSAFASSNSPFFTKTLEPNAAACAIDPGGGCDIVISSVNPTNETQPSASDGTATINASTSATGLVYSIDNVTFQSSNLFSNLAPGNYNATVKDANNCVASQPFTILAYNNPVVDFNDGLPVVAIPANNISKWNAAFNPIVFTYQRKDYTITSITQSGTQIKVQLSTTLPYAQYFLALNGMTYIKSPKYDFTAQPVAYDPGSGFTYNMPFYGNDTTGLLNVDLLKQNFFVETEITAGNNPTEPIVIIATNSPSAKGVTKADVAPFLRTLLSKDDTYSYLQSSYRDYNLGGSFTLRYREVWDTGNGQWFYAPYPLYYTYAAKQLGEKYGGNMAQYVPFMSVSNNSYKAKFLTDFEKPTKWDGLPFDLQFIYSEDIINQSLTMEIVPNCGNTESALLLNADATYLLNADDSRFIIQRVYNDNIQGYPIIEALGVNRALIPDLFDCCATELKTNIKYGTTYIMQDLYIKHECQCDDPYVYLKWLNSRGGWDYWRFGYNQGVTNTTNGSEKYTKFVNDWENDTTIEDWFSRQGNKKLTLVAGQLEAQELRALSWLTNSLRVQMYMGNYKWQTVIISDGDFAEADTRKNKGNVKIQITLPAKNIQQG